MNVLRKLAVTINKMEVLNLKPNKLSRGYNVIWESSRMMLPEHKEWIRKNQKKKQYTERPELDEQELSLIADQLQLAWETKSRVQLTCHHPLQTLHLAGQIRKIDHVARCLQLNTESGREWVQLEEIIAAEAILPKEDI